MIPTDHDVGHPTLRIESVSAFGDTPVVEITTVLRLVLDLASKNYLRRSVLTIAPYRAFENVLRRWRQSASEGRSRTVEWRAILNAGEKRQNFESRSQSQR
jgi:hypothetical protein